jgi:prolyl-tRNA synthetase
MMGDGKALQMGTSHELGQNFALVFDIVYTTATGGQEVCWTTSWGSTTRMLGGLIMCHGDDNGLRVPPRVAPVQVLVTVVKAGEGVVEAARQLVADLVASGVRAELDDRSESSGRRIREAELQKIPYMLVVGDREIEEGSVAVRRHGEGDLGSEALEAFAARVAEQRPIGYTGQR